MQVFGLASRVGIILELRRDPWVLGRVEGPLLDPVFAHRPGYAEINHGNPGVATADVNTDIVGFDVIMN